MAGLASGRPFALWLPAHLADSRCCSSLPELEKTWQRQLVDMPSQTALPSNSWTGIAERSMPSSHRRLTAAMRLPLGSAASAYGWMPQVGQKRCSMACLSKVQVLAASSGVRKTRSLRGTNRSNEPLRGSNSCKTRRGWLAGCGALPEVHRTMPLPGCRRRTEALAVEARLIKTANTFLA